MCVCVRGASTYLFSRVIHIKSPSQLFRLNRLVDQTRMPNEQSEKKTTTSTTTKIKSVCCCTNHLTHSHHRSKCCAKFIKTSFSNSKTQQKHIYTYGTTSALKVAALHTAAAASFGMCHRRKTIRLQWTNGRWMDKVSEWVSEC